jgi:hypothetical protein
MLTPFLGQMGRASLAKAVAVAAGEPGLALVAADAGIARALTSRGFRVLALLAAPRARARAGELAVRASFADLPVAAGTAAAVVCAGRGAELRGAAEDALAAAALLRGWLRPLRPGGVLVLVDRLDSGLLGTRTAASREDLCAALLAARLIAVAQTEPKSGTVVTRAAMPRR